MTTPGGFKGLLERRRPLLGMFMFTGSPMLVEILGSTGFDFVILDVEHANAGIDDVPGLVRAAESFGLCPLVRVPDARPHEIGKALDAGAAGIVLSHVQTAETAERAAAMTRYPTDGERSMCTAIRSSGYASSDWEAYIRRANDETVFVPLIEDPLGVEQMEAIAKVPDVDGLFIGPGDLSQSLGGGSQGHRHPAAEEATRRSIELARAHDKFAMGVVYPEVTPEAAADLVARGIEALVYSIDARVFFNAARSVVRDVKAAISEVR